MRPTILSIFALSLITFTVVGKKPIQLTDENFEHDTQASTGATTGDWFISFCDRATNMQHCMATDGIWSRLSETLNRRVSVAQVDL